MPKTTTISKEKLANLEGRAKKLAADKAHLQLIVRLMNRISAVSGLDNTVEALLQTIGDVIGGINLCLYYVLDENIYYCDAFGNKKRLDAVEDSLVKKVFETRKPIEHEHAVSDTQMLMTPEFTNAYTWAVPLLVGEELIAVIKIESLHVAMRELSKQLPTFFSHAAFVLKNEILGQTRLKKAYDNLEQEVAVRKKAEEELRRANEVLEERVAERTSELQSALDAEKQAEEAVRKSAEEIQDLYEHAPCGYHSLDKDGVFVRINDTELSWLGYTRKDLVGKIKFHELLPPQSLERYRLQFSGFKERGWVNDLDFEMVRKNGTILPVLLSATAIKTADGEFVMSRSVVHDITERKRAAEKAAALAAIVESSDDAIIGKTLEGVITSWNKGAETIYGYTEEETIGSPISFLVPPELEDEVPGILARLKKGEHIKHYETRRKRKDGQIIDIALSISPIRNAEGQVIAACTIARDITERKRAEEEIRALNVGLEARVRQRTQELAESEERMRLFFERQLVGMAITSPQKGWLQVNDKLCQMMGYSREELAHLTWAEMTYPEDLPSDVAQFERLLNGEIEDYMLEKRFLRKDGSIVFTNLAAGCVRKADGTVDYALSLVEDITERKRAEEAIRTLNATLEERVLERTAQLKEAINTLNSEISERKQAEEAQRRLNRELRAISNCNQILMRAEDEETLLNAICHIVCEEADYRMAWVGYAEHDDAKTIRPIVWAGVEDGYLAAAKLTWADTERGRGPTGTAIRTGESAYIQDLATDDRAALWRERAMQRGYHSSIALALKDENANTFGVFTIYSTEPNAFTHDEVRLLEELAGDLAFGITTLRGRVERKRAEEAMKQAKEAAEAANQAKDQFLAMLSHELRTPLTPVLATVSALQAQEDVTAELRADMDLIRRNVEMEAKLVDDLLDVTRISRGKMELHPEIVDAHLLLRTALEICLPDIEAKHMDISLSLQADPHQVRADPTRLRQVFWNLLKNAVEFTPEKGRISLRTTNANGRLKIEIEDTGIGIHSELLPKIFNAFERGDQTTFRRFGGLGLGLSIAKTVMEMHQGTLTAFSEGEGKGATFTVELPSIAPASPPPLPPPLLANEEHPRKILLVDDHPDTLRTMSKLLNKWGYAVVTADCVRAALEMAAKESFDVLLSDLGLPDGSGMDIMRDVKRLYALRGIAFSGYGTEEDIRRSLDAGFEKHLTKPVSFQDLRNAIRAIMSEVA